MTILELSIIFSFSLPLLIRLQRLPGPVVLSRSAIASCIADVKLVFFRTQVVDVTSGKVLGPNEKGELLYSSPGAMRGYHGRPDATKAIFDEDRWMRSGERTNKSLSRITSAAQALDREPNKKGPTSRHFESVCF